MRKIIIILFLTISSVVSATTYYVSTSGNNANNGLTTTTPWQTVQYAESKAINAGDVIALKRGDVWLTSIALGIHHGGISGNPITWDGALWGTGANAIIRSSADRSAPNMSVVNIIGTSYVTFQNITVDGNNTNTFGLVVGGTDNYYSAGGVQNSEKGITIQNSAVLNSGNGNNYTLGFLVQTWKNGMSDITVKGNTLDGADDELLSFYGGKSPDGGTPAECNNVYIGYNTLTNWGRRGTSTGFGLQLNNKITDVIIEHNTLTTGPDGFGTALQIESNEPLPGWFPDRITVRYNKIYATKDTYGMYITDGEARTVNVYYNLLFSESKSTNGGGIWINKSSTPSWSGAKLNFFNNTIYTLSGRSVKNDCAVPGVVTLKNNLIYNAGNDDYGMMCLVNNTTGATLHNNNLYYRNAGVNFTKVKDGGDYIQTPEQVLAWEASAKIGDPLFKVPGTDLRLQTGSPGIGAGIAISGITKDLEGTLINNPPDIGCYQSSIAAPAPAPAPAPVYLTSFINESTPNAIEMTYDLSLATVVPAITAFNVKVNSVDRAVTSVGIVEGEVKLTIASPVVSGDVTTLSYTKPSVNPLQSKVGGVAESILSKSVTNSVITSAPDTVPEPEVVVEAVVEAVVETEVVASSAPVQTEAFPPGIKLTVYPNPVHRILNILCEYTSTYSEQEAIIAPNSIKIFDSAGRLMLERRLEPGITSQQFPVNFRSGVFVVLLVSKGVTLSSQKFIVYN